MLLHDIHGVDRQEKQIKYDNALVAFMVYFISDSFWAAIIAGVLPANRFTVFVTNFCNLVFMAAISYNWLHYVLAVNQIDKRNFPIQRFAISFPFLIDALAYIVIYFIDPEALITAELNTTPLYSLLQNTVPIIYIVAILFYSIRIAVRESNPIDRRKSIFIGLFPLTVVFGGLLQIIILPDVPVFCYCCAIMMLIFYIQSMEGQISVDPLTGLNNRGQLMRYVSYADSLHREDRPTYVMMLDVNDFKSINDTYGHAEGDRALRIIADSLKDVAGDLNMPAFLGRYGGDEFIVIANPKNEEALVRMSERIRERISAKCALENTGYSISIGIGYDELAKSDDSFIECMQRADHKLYTDKAKMKSAVSE